jgi:predicted metal-dependent phosphoesterase TrpH
MIERRPIDLHAHTSCSDGRLTPEELVDLAKKAGLAALAITDHDTVDGIAPAIRYADGLEVVSGVELSASEGQSDIHVLGYFLDPQHAALLDHLRAFRAYRYERAQRMVEKLNWIGITLTLDDVLACTSGETASIGRPHVAQALVARKQVASMDEAFRVYLGSHAPAYVPKSRLTVPEAVRIIREAGGVAVLAHPGSLNRDELIPGFVKAGLEGLEVIHPDHNEAARRYYRQLAEKYGLATTGGTDYHGNREGKPALGALQVPYRHLEALRHRLASRQR